MHASTFTEHVKNKKPFDSINTRGFSRQLINNTS